MGIETLPAAFAEFGATAEEVADRLAAEGVRGVPRACEDCPVVRWLRLRYPGHRFRFDGNTVEIDGEGRFRVPYGVFSFAQRFDVGAWPHLRDVG